jgi:ABC-2 type transport system permease protein
LKHTWTLTKMRMQLAMRNRIFLFFSLVMPLAFFFLFAGVFGKGDPNAVAYLLGPVLALTIMGSFWGLSASLVMFREQGILRRFRVAPVSPADMLASSLIANYILTLPTVAVELALARLLFHVRDFGNLWSLFVLVTVGTVSFAALGLVVASVTNTMQETQVICQIIWFALLFFSGATFPLPMLPKAIQHLADFLPATYLVYGLQLAIKQSASVWHLAEAVFPLAGWAVLAFFISTQLFRWESEERVTRNAKVWAAASILPFLLLGAWESTRGQIRRESSSMFDRMRQPSAPQNPGRQ